MEKNFRNDSKQIMRVTVKAKSQKLISSKKEGRWFRMFYKVLHKLSLTQDPLWDQQPKTLQIELPLQKKVIQSTKLLVLNEEDTPTLQRHPAYKYFWGTLPEPSAFHLFVRCLHQGVVYATQNLKGPSKEFISKKAILLPERQEPKTKFLFLDLDQTLIHCCPTGAVQLREDIRLNIRPYVSQFLSNMSEYFQIYVFTAASLMYATWVVEYLNKEKKTIQGIMSREQCMLTSNGLKIKDLRIIRNRGLKDIVLIDNLIHSFGLQIDNGIPILSYIDNKNDSQLCGLQPFLIRLSAVQDVRVFLRQQLQLRTIGHISEEYFLNM